MNDKISSSDADVQTLTAIRGRLEKATKGPWLFDGISYCIGIFRHMLRADGNGTTAADAEFIAHARQDIPWLLQRDADREAHVAQLQGALLEANTNYAGRDLEAASYLARAEAAERDLTELRQAHETAAQIAVELVEAERARTDVAERERDEARADDRRHCEEALRYLFERNNREARLQEAERLLASTGAQEGQIRELIVRWRVTEQRRNPFRVLDAQTVREQCASELEALFPAPRHEETSRTTTTEDALTRTGELDILPASQHASTDTKG